MESEVKDREPEGGPRQSFADPGAPRQSRAFASPGPEDTQVAQSSGGGLVDCSATAKSGRGSFHTSDDYLRNEFCKTDRDSAEWDSIIPEALLPKFIKAGELSLMRKINHGHIDNVTFEDCQEMIALLGDDEVVHEITYVDTDGDFVAFRLNRNGFVDYYTNGHMLLLNLSDVTMEGHRLTVKGTTTDGVGVDGHFITSVPHAREQLAQRVTDLFYGRKAGKAHKDTLGYLFKEVMEPQFSDVEVEEVLKQTDKSSDGMVCTQELFAALSAGPVRHLIKHLQMEKFEVAQDLGRAEIDRDFMLDRVRWRVDVDDAFFTLPGAISLGAVLCILVICHLQVWARKQVEWGLEDWMAQDSLGTLHLHAGSEDNEAVDFGNIKDDRTFWYWLDTIGAENIVGTVINHRNGGSAIPVVGSNILLGGLRINQGEWLLQPNTSRSFWGPRNSSFLLPLRAQLQNLTDLRHNLGLESLHMEFITYSERSFFFSVFDINVDFDSYGYVNPTMSATAVMFNPYPAAYAYMFDVLYLILAATLFYGEVGQLFSAAKLGFRAFREYWEIWNIVDWVSITMGVVNLVLWFFCLRAMEDPALTALMTAGDPFRIDSERVDVMRLTAEELDGVMAALYHLQTLFLALQLAILLAAVAVMLKCFKGFRANPRLAVVAITLNNGARDIGHFFIVFFCIFFVFACTGHVLFGTDRPEFYTLASSVKTAFKVLMGDFAWYTELTDNRDERNSLESGMPRVLMTVWFFVFMMLVSLVMLNMLLAVILEQYILVANKNKLPGDTDGTLWSQTNRFYKRGKETRGFIKLSKLKAMLDHSVNPAHPDPEVTQSSLVKAFPGMKDEQAQWIIDWLHTESLKQLERDKAKEYEPGLIAEIVERNARYGNYVSEQLRLVSLGVQNWDSCLWSLGTDMSALRNVLQDTPTQAPLSERSPASKAMRTWPPMAALNADMGSPQASANPGSRCSSLAAAQLRVAVSPYGVLGLQRASGATLRQAPQPDARVAILDPAGLHFIQGSPALAGGAAGAVYEWLEIKGDATFPEPVRRAIQQPLAAKLHRYGAAAAPKTCIHVVGPDFRELPDASRQGAVEKLATAYKNALAEFASAPFLCVLRLLPISGSIFAGRFVADMPAMTAEALQMGFRQLQKEHQQQVLRPDRAVEMCIFEEAQLAEYTKAFEDVAGAEFEDQVPRQEPDLCARPGTPGSRARSSRTSRTEDANQGPDLALLAQQADESEQAVRDLQHEMQLLIAKCEAMRATQNVARVQVVRGNLRQERTECCPIASALQRSPTPPEMIN